MLVSHFANHVTTDEAKVRHVLEQVLKCMLIVMSYVTKPWLNLFGGKGKTLTYTTLHVAMVNSCILLVY